MSNTYFITSRKGQINSLNQYEYRFTKELNSKSHVKPKFLRWLKTSNRNVLIGVSKLGFTTIDSLEEKKNWQYSLIRESKIIPPFENTPLISNYLGDKLRRCFNQSFEQFLQQNVFVIDHLDLNPFHLLKCFQFNIEVFEDGEFYIHLLPVSKIVSSEDVNKDYLIRLKKEYNSQSVAENMLVTLLDTDSKKRFRIDLFDEKFISKSESFIKEKHRVIASFDYHFVAKYSPNLFGKIVNSTKKEVSDSIEFLKLISDQINIFGDIDLCDKPFFKVSKTELSIKNNLIVGNNFIANQQSAAFYNGIYEPVTDYVIQPLCFDNAQIGNFHELIQKFNNNGDITILEEINLNSNEDIDYSQFIEASKKFINRYLIVVFTKHKLPHEILQPLKLRFQTYLGNIDKYKLSNFSVKCLEKIGGKLSAINNSFEPETTYFLGIDLGHTTHKKEKYSNLGVTLFNNKGILVAHGGVEKIRRDEALNKYAFQSAIKYVLKSLERNGNIYPKKIIIHRDGKTHLQDYNCFEGVLKNKFRIQEYDVVEVIKSGYPIFAKHDSLNKEYLNPASGDYWMNEEKKYAILVTNDQARDTESTLNPIIIKHKFGDTVFRHIVEQIYCFTKIYTNNLYNSTRLPATTEKANNICGTGNKRHISTFRA